MIGFEKEIDLFFLVAGHTKQSCDSMFGVVKTRSKERDVVSPTEMMGVIEDRSIKNRLVCSTRVGWVDWKEYLVK